MKELYKYIYYDGIIYQARKTNPYNQIDSNANWLNNANDGFERNNGRTCSLENHNIPLRDGLNMSRCVTAKFEDLLFLTESDKNNYPEYFI